VPRLRPDEMIDRIDQVYVAGAVDVLDAQIVGEAGGPDVDIPIQPFPSDHRGVVVALDVTLAEPPLFVAVKEPAIRQGDELVVRYHAPAGEATDKIAIVAAGQSTPLYWQPPYEAEFFGSVTFGTGTLPPAEYAVILLNEANEELSRSRFWVLARDAQPSISTDKPSYRVGETISVLWANSPAYCWDWVGVYALDDPDLYNNYLVFAYTESRSSGELSLSSEDFGEALPAGEYEVRLLRDDGYFVMASATFTVQE